MSSLKRVISMLFQRGKSSASKMFMEKNHFGFEPTSFDGSEHVFGAGTPVQSVPEAYSYEKFLPPVLNQGQESICVPCSVSAYLNWRENLSTGSKNDNKIDYYELYGARKDKVDGMTYKEAFHYLRHHGVTSNAGVLKIREYALVRSSLQLKLALVINGPCFGALPVYSDRDDFWNKYPGDDFYGYHAVSIVGYGKDGFIIRNSWGSSFAQNGYTLLKYEDFPKLLEIWTVID